VVGSELEVNILAFADLLEVGFLVSGDVVAKQVEGRQCPDGGYGRCSMDGAGVSVLANVLIATPVAGRGSLNGARFGSSAINE